MEHFAQEIAVISAQEQINVMMIDKLVDDYIKRGDNLISIDLSCVKECIVHDFIRLYRKKEKVSATAIIYLINPSDIANSLMLMRERLFFTNVKGIHLIQINQ
ncbi:hypothetical protein ACFQZR_19645 [Paenibacillus sp. GCM10027629]